MAQENLTENERARLMIEALRLESDNDLLRAVIENVGNVIVEDISAFQNGFEVFINPSSFTGQELNNLQELFNIREMGIYGDPDLPDENTYLYLHIEV